MELKLEHTILTYKYVTLCEIINCTAALAKIQTTSVKKMETCKNKSKYALCLQSCAF